MLSLVWNLRLHYQTIEDQARIIARTAFEKDVLYRSWNSSFGGVYVGVSPNSQPNPYLKDIPERDMETTTGRLLTMINPAYMTRQVFELQQKNMGVIGHITSLKPIRPLNAADEWETTALKSFDLGEKESSTLVETEGQSYLRLMKPLVVEEKCLKCHATQGYSIGQIRGGISETVPLAPLQTAAENSLVSIIVAHSIIWIIGILGIFWSNKILMRSLVQQKYAEQKLLDLSTHDRLTGLFNRAYFEDIFQQLEEIQSHPISIVMADIDLLKQTNDTYGHAAGDELIRRASQVFQECFRSNDIIARVGGDEFVVIIQNSSEEKAKGILQRLKDTLASHNAAYYGSPLEISFGIATSKAFESLNTTFKLADERMYENKQAKKKHLD